MRYVDVGDTHAGTGLIELGLAIARYDSRDGYGRHPREDGYVAADGVMENIACEDDEPEPQAVPEPEPEPEPTPAPEAEPEKAAPPPTRAESFANCDELNRSYPGGVAKNGVTGNMVSGELRSFGRAPTFDDALYSANTGRDRDKDGIACEQ